MEFYKDLYNRLLKASVQKKLGEEIDKISGRDDICEQDLDALLHPEKQGAVVVSGRDCQCPNDKPCDSQLACLFSAIKRDENGKVTITAENCTGCGACIEKCRSSKLMDRKDIVPLFEMLYTRDVPVYAMIAPAFIGQFSSEVTPGKLRSAFKCLGFYGMVEVALFADILTLKEALEFHRLVHDEKDFILTSCCCPIWVAMIKKLYKSLIPRVPPSVSPMVACGRSIKKVHPEAKTVFIGPCVAKKAEAKEPDISDAVDFVLTFQEVKEIFEVAGINPAEMPEDLRDHSSTAGRIYARTGGVSEAVARTLERLAPDHKVPLVARQGDGIPQCKEMLEKIASGDIDANFIEGMGCRGGCVGGPKAVLSVEEGTKNVNEYGKTAAYKTPVDNPYVMEMLSRLGFDSVESLLEHDSYFVRHFSETR